MEKAGQFREDFNISIEVSKIKEGENVGRCVDNGAHSKRDNKVLKTHLVWPTSETGRDRVVLLQLYKPAESVHFSVLTFRKFKCLYACYMDVK